MNKTILMSFGIIILASLIMNISAAEPLDNYRVERLNFGHVMKIKNVSTTPSDLIPGQSGNLDLTIENTAAFEILDIRMQINLPEEIFFLEDISKKKLARLSSGQSSKLNYNIIISPEAEEGVYEVVVTTDYVDHVGEERQDNDTFGVIIKSAPKLFIKVEGPTLRSQGDVGEITLTFVNNDIGNIKFLTAGLLESEAYDVISTNKEYIGDLDSDDFESIDFKIRLNTKEKEVPLRLNLDYKDALNKDYSQEIEVNLNILTAKEAGEATRGIWSNLIWVIIIIGIGYWIYKKKIKNKKTKK